MFKSPWLNISLLHLVKFYYRKSLCGITEESWRNRMSDPSRLQSFRPVEWWLSPWWISVVVVGGIDTVGVCTKEASMKENWDSWCRLSDFVLTTKKPERFFGAIELIYYWKLQQKSTKIDETQDSKALHPKVVDKADFWSHGASPIRLGFESWQVVELPPGASPVAYGSLWFLFFCWLLEVSRQK